MLEVFWIVSHPPSHLFFLLFLFAPSTEDLGVIPENLVKLLTASVIMSMSLTPLLGELAEYVGAKFEDQAASEMAIEK